MMLIRMITAAGLCFFYVTPAFAQSQTHSHLTERQATPHPIAAVTFGERRIEMLAVTARGRADTALHKEYLYESRSMSKVYPGYPQQAFVSVDFRVKF
jgi:hypothetical protein